MDEKSVFLSQDCFTPACFSESIGVSDISLQGAYRQALIVYGYTKPPITITFRDEARGDGAFFDHYNIQKITGRKTEISLPNGWSAKVFYDAIKKKQLKLPQNTSENSFPAVSSNSPDDLGLMIVPGYSNATIDKRPRIHQERINHEITMINKGREYGWSIFAICGGLWTLVQAIGGTVKLANHHRGAMPKLLENGEVDLGSTPHIHLLLVDPNTKMAKLMGLNQHSMQYLRLKALSVHWQAVDKLPIGFRFSAFATEDMKEVEAIENDDDNSVIIGIQGHPEAMRNNHAGLFHSTQKHHALINNTVKVGDEYHRKRLNDKADQVGKYSSAELMQKFGVARGSYLTQAEEKEQRNSVLGGLDYVGLSLQELSHSKNSLFNAVAACLSQNPQDLQELIATNIEHHQEKYASIVAPLLLSLQTYEDYAHQVRLNTWTEDIEIKNLMSLLDRAIIVISSQGAITHDETVGNFLGDPLFVFYNGNGHYDALLQHSDISAKETLERLHWNSVYKFQNTRLVSVPWETLGHLGKIGNVHELTRTTSSSETTFAKLKQLGLALEEIDGDDDCLYNAIGLHIGEDAQFIRNIVAANLENNRAMYEPIVNALLRQGETFMDYVNGIRRREWGDNLELSVLMRLLDRVILVVQPDGKIENRDAINTYLGDPIFVFYNGHNHYDGFIRTGKLSGRQIYEQLTQFEVERVNSCTSLDIPRLKL